MKRRTSTKSVKIITYGCRVRKAHRPVGGIGPVAEAFPGEGLVREQLRRAQYYYDELVDIQNKRLARFRAIRRKVVPNIETLERRAAILEEGILSLREQQRLERASEHAERRGKAGRAVKPKREINPKLKERITRIVGRLKPLRERLKEAKQKFDELTEPAVKEFQARRDELAGKEPGKVTGPHALRAARKAVLEEMLAENWPDYWKDICRIEDDALEEIRESRDGCDVDPGTYLLVEKAFESAKKGGDPERRIHGRGRPPLWAPGLPEEGRVGVLLHHLSVADLYAGSGALAIAPLPSDQWSSRSKRAHAITRARLFLGKGRPPVEIVINQHRPLPDDAVVTQAWLKVREIGFRPIYELQLVVESDKFERKPTGAGRAALHLAWRATPRGLRVGYFVHENGKERELLLPEENGRGLVNRLEVSDELRRVSDLLFNDAVKRFVELVRSWPGGAPVFLAESAAYAHTWHKHSRLTEIAERLANAELGPWKINELWTAWRDSRSMAKKLTGVTSHPAGAQFHDLLAQPAVVSAWAERHGLSGRDAMIFWLYLWRKKEIHLTRTRAHGHQGAQAARLDHYRRLALLASTEAAELVIEKPGLDKQARKPKAEQKEALPQKARDHRVLAATSILRNLHVERFGKARVTIVEGATFRHHVGCGGELEVNPTALRLQCTGCGKAVDRDKNACLALLERSYGEPRPGAARNRQKDKDVADVRTADEQKGGDETSDYAAE